MPAPSRTTGRPRDPDIDAAVLAATRELLVEVGYQRLGLGLVAARAGSNRPALYRRWPSKAHLVYDAVFPSEPDLPLAATIRFEDHVRALIERIVASYSRPAAREAVPALLAETRDLERRSSIVDGLLGEARKDFAARVQQAVARGDLRADTDAALVLDVIHSAAMHQANSRARPDPHFAGRLTDLVLAGVHERSTSVRPPRHNLEEPMHDRRITMDDGTKLRYRVGGRGDASLVFVHGWCSTLTHWADQLAHFAGTHRVLAVDRRGHGRSDVPERGYDVARHAADLRAVLQKEHLRDVVVVAHAGGGPTALAFADANPDLVRALVLVDTHISPHTALGRPRSAERSPLGRLVDQLSGKQGAAAFERMYRSFFSAHAGTIANAAVRDAQRVPLRVARAELASLAVDTEGPARRLRCPVLWVTVEQADEPRMRSVFRDVQFGRVVGSGHFPHLEVPDQLNAMIDRFLVTLPSAPPAP